MADGLRALLARQGAVEQADAAAQPMLLLSNRSDRQWLARHEATGEDPNLLLVVGTAIGLPRTLDWVTRRQWIDLRRGALPPGSTAALLPLLPEAVTQLRLPPAVARLHALLCALGVLLCMLGYLLTPAEVLDRDEASAQAAVGALLGGLLVWCARRLLRREQPAVSLRRWLQRLLVAAVPFALVLPWLPDLPGAARATGMVGAVAVALLAGACWRGLPAVQTWLPQALPLPPAAQRLAPPADWRTTLVVTAWLFGWMLPVQLFVPQLMP